MKRIIAPVIGTAALLIATAGPAMASDNPVNVSAEVSNTITLSGLSPSIDFGQILPGTPVNKPGAEVYTVATNDPAGYSLVLSFPANGLTSGANSIPLSALNMQEAGAGHSPNVLTGTSFTLNNTSAPSSDNYTENWMLTPPASLAAGNYSGAFTYTLTAN